MENIYPNLCYPIDVKFACQTWSKDFGKFC